MLSSCLEWCKLKLGFAGNNTKKKASTSNEWFTYTGGKSTKSCKSCLTIAAIGSHCVHTLCVFLTRICVTWAFIPICLGADFSNSTFVFNCLMELTIMLRIYQSNFVLDQYCCKQSKKGYNSETLLHHAHTINTMTTTLSQLRIMLS